MIQKQKILNLNNIYTANAFHTGTALYIGAGSETDPVVHLYDLAKNSYEQVDDCPGGMMSFVPVPGKPGNFVTIMGLFPPFIGKEAGLFMHQKTAKAWKTVKAMDLPFVHRCEFISHNGVDYLVATTVSKLKENPGDWSQPGEIHIISMEDNSSLPWKSKIINSGITRNHGMMRATLDGTQSLFVSGAEGIFNIIPGFGGEWEVKPVFEKEVSEMTFIDLDGDGINEMITIEPFHGEILNIYKKQPNGWSLRFSDSLSFGHGLSSGLFNENPVVVVGNRSGTIALEIFTVSDLSKGIVNRKVIEENAGPTQSQVFSYNSTDYILSANQRKNEVALYTGTLD